MSITRIKVKTYPLPPPDSGCAGQWGAQAVEAAELESMIESHGITPVTMFDWDGRRFTNASEAIAAARRREAWA